jgi:hypothetical protein
MYIDSRYSTRGYEYIQLTSNELEEVVPKRVDAELDQFDSDSSSRLTIFNGSYLRVSRTGDCDGPHDYWINLAFLDPRPVRRADRFWSRFSTTLALLTTVAVALTYWQSTIALGPVQAMTIATLSAATLASAINALCRYYSRCAFLTTHGRAPVLWLSSRKPNRRQVSEFIQHLHRAVARAKADRVDVVRGHHLRDEMKEHRRLHNAGVLDDRQFQVARRLILEAHG